jgi:hypothetical protein
MQLGFDIFLPYEACEAHYYFLLCDAVRRNIEIKLLWFSE